MYLTDEILGKYLDLFEKEIECRGFSEWEYCLFSVLERFQFLESDNEDKIFECYENILKSRFSSDFDIWENTINEFLKEIDSLGFSTSLKEKVEKELYFQIYTNIHYSSIDSIFAGLLCLKALKEITVINADDKNRIYSRLKYKLNKSIELFIKEFDGLGEKIDDFIDGKVKHLEKLYGFIDNLEKLSRGLGFITRDIKRFIEKNKPILAICGHLHENEGKSEKISKTLIINPGIKGKIIKI